MSRVLANRLSALKEAVAFSSQCRGFARGKGRGPPPPEDEGDGKTDLDKKEVEALLKHSTVGYPQDFKTPEHLWQTNPYEQDPTLEQRFRERNQAAHSFR